MRTDRLGDVELALRALRAEVRTRRLVVEGGEGGEGTARIVGDVVDGTAELRLELPGGRPGRRSAVVLFATPAGAAGAGGRYGLGPALGLQLWAEGDALCEIDAWPDADGRWRAHLHLHGD
jgi:hypothetical protein